MTGTEFDYNDGAEKSLKEIFQNPGFDEHSAWIDHSNNWPVHYHLSPLRKNLLSWLNYFYDSSGKSVLELGGGCGAITSLLTDFFNFKKITTVEGATDRAELIKARCKNSLNLEVINKNIIEFETKEKYDLVLVIGVLEYSGKYIEGNDPFYRFLKHARSFVNEKGTVVLAIENQLGHKYLAGNHEDHYWIPYEGLSGYPNSTGIRTFDKKTLSGLLEKSGLTVQKWFYPFPDYKMPSVIFSDEGLCSADFDWKPLMDTPTKDFSYNKALTFNEKEFLKILQNTTGINNFMNSFLVFAGEKNVNIDLEDILAVKLNTLRKKEFCQAKIFKKIPGNNIRVETHPIFKNSLVQGKTEEYFKAYSNLFEDIISGIYLKDYKNAASLILLWNDALKSKMNKSNEVENKKDFKEFSLEFLKNDTYSSETRWLNSNFLDLIPYNILYNPKNADYKIIDLEWELYPAPVPIQLIIDRGMHYIMIKLNQLSGIPILNGFKWNLPEEICTLIPGEFYCPDFISLQLCETWFFNAVLYKSEILNDGTIAGIKSEFLPVSNFEIENVVKTDQVQSNVFTRVVKKLLIVLAKNRISYRIARKIVRLNN